MKATNRQQILKSVNDLIQSVTSLVDSMSSATEAARPARTVASASRGRRGGARGAWTSERRAKLKRSIASYWSKLTPEQHAARVKKMLAGRGLKPKRGK
jgi:hypothetical protein